VQIHRFLKIDLFPGESAFLWGARQTGKSTYLLEAFPQALYINLLDSELYRHYSQQPSRLRQELLANPNIQYIILDEFQKIPQLLDEVHLLISSNKNLSFILCGSSIRRLKATGANLLGGRACSFPMLPLCYAERGDLQWGRIFNQGLLPSHYLSERPVDRFLASYLYDYILPEVQFEGSLRNREPFSKFLDLLGFCNAEMIVYSNISRDCGVDPKTIKTYFEILEDMYLGYMVYPFRSKAKRQMITDTPKFYFFDTGLINYLRSYKYTEMMGAQAGQSFEHYIFLELNAYQKMQRKRSAITYWRTKEGYEVDFVIGQTIAIDVKITNSVDRKHLTGLLQFHRDHEEASLHLISLEPNKRVLTEGAAVITLWPVELFLKALWAQEFWEAP